MDKDKIRTVRQLRSGYKKSTRTTRKGKGSETEHWDGRRDAHIVVEAVRVRRRKESDR